MKNTSSVGELERTITILLIITFFGAHLATFLQIIGIVTIERVEAGSIVLPLASVLLFTFDIMLLVKKEYRKFTILDIILILSFVSLTVSLIIANDFEMAISGADLHAEGYPVYVSYLVILFSATFIQDNKNRRLLYYGMTLFAVLEVILGMLQGIIRPEFLQESLSWIYFGGDRAFGTFENPNPYGSAMAVFLSVEAMATFFTKNKFTLPVHIVLLVTYGFGLFMSGTRGAMVGFGIAALLFSVVFIVKSIKQKQIKGTLCKLCIVIICIAIALGVLTITAKNTYSDLVNRVETDANVSDISALGENRVVIWERTLQDYVKKGNIFFGTGIANICQMIPMGEGYPLLNYDAHNRYLNTLCTQGAVGLILYVILIAWAIKSVLTSKEKLERWRYILLMPFVCYLVADVFCIGVYGLTPFLYIILGMLMPRINQKSIISQSVSTEV